MIVYIAGPITGNERYKEQFASAQRQLEMKGHKVLNPAMLPNGLGDCNKYMIICLSMIDVSEFVVMLPGWENSLGACREWGYAKGQDKFVIDLKTMLEVKTDV